MVIKTNTILVRLQTYLAAGFAPSRQTVRATAYRLATEIGFCRYIQHETETAGYGC